ncbi:MAG: hypothetical protein GW859_08895 [Sphingomonadales bacterium]|nr:hypothetical protein [Sphingomonadales bacterium]
MIRWLLLCLALVAASMPLSAAASACQDPTVDAPMTMAGKAPPHHRDATTEAHTCLGCSLPGQAGALVRATADLPALHTSPRVGVLPAIAIALDPPPPRN